VSTGARVIAVEPLAAMRARLEQAVPGAQSLDGTAEAIPLPDASVDAVTVAQAFHWFRFDEALAELHRVLRPGGGLALVWNEWREEDRLVAAVEAIVVPLRGEVPTRRGGGWRDEFATSRLFGPLEETTFEYVQTIDAEQLVSRVLSISVVAALPPDEKAAVAERVRALTDGLPERFPLPYDTRVFLCHRS